MRSALAPRALLRMCSAQILAQVASGAPHVGLAPVASAAKDRLCSFFPGLWAIRISVVSKELVL